MTKELLVEPIEIANALEEMGLDRDGLTKAVLYALSERDLCTSNDPIGFDSMTAYARAGRSLRETYLLRGWSKDDSNNQCAIKHVAKKLRIVPCNFDEFAGNSAVQPTNKSPKGEVSRRSSRCNATAWLPGLPVPTLADLLWQTWVLGFYANADRSHIGAELSLPVSFHGDFYSLFKPRIILLSGNAPPLPSKSKLPNDDDALGVVDIPVTKK
jgi:hypothetical protein